jgi:hypothetical protein
MTDLTPPRLDPISMAWNTVASYDSYEQAQAAVDRLSDEQFPVENLDIVGSGLHSVERVTGRLTKARAAAGRCARARVMPHIIRIRAGDRKCLPGRVRSFAGCMPDLRRCSWSQFTGDGMVQALIGRAGRQRWPRR